MNSAFETIEAQLRAWYGRYRLQNGLVWAPRGLLAGLLLAVVAATVTRLRPFLTNRELGWLALALAGVGLLIALIVVLGQRAALPQQARFADRQFRLQERASTAVEIHAGLLSVPPALAQQQFADTVAAIERVDTAAALPLRLARRDWVIILVAAALLGTAVLLPNPQESTLLQQRAVDASIDEQIAELEALTEEIQENPALTEAQQEELTAPLESALTQLQEGEMGQEEAVAALSEAEAELRELAAENSTTNLQQTLQNAGQPLAENSAGQSLGQALQGGNLSQAGAAAAQLADALPSLSSEEQAALAADLAETAAALQGVDDQLAQQLAEAAAALQNGDTAAAQQALQDAAATLQQRAQQNAAAQQAQAAAGQLNQGRQDVAQAGQQNSQAGAQQGSGEQMGPGAGQGQQAEGSGSGQQPGGGEGGAPGQGQSGAPGAGGNEGAGTGGPGPGGGHAENVYAPDLVDLSDTEGVDIELPAECVANPESCGGLLSETATEFGDEQSVVPYDQVFGDYRDAANEALADDYIPLGLKGYIRDYFSSLEP